MDQIKTGRFIAQMRKEKGLTQRELADKLCISDKTVSKWETGRGMPEVSLMLPLCEGLGINVNELLTGARVPEDSYKQKAEENMMDLIRNNRGRGKIAALMAMIGVLMLLPVAALGILPLVCDVSDDAVYFLTVFSVISAVVGCAAIMFVDCSVGYYECSECGEKFTPSFGRYIASPFHRPTSRLMRCPKCGKKNWCTKNLY